MTTFGEFLKKEREKKSLNQSDFGYELDIIMTDISKIENGHKKFPFGKLEKLAALIDEDIESVKDKFVADILVSEANKYECSENVFSIAEGIAKYMRSKNEKQANINFK